MESEAEKHKRYFCSFQGCAAAYNKQWKLDAHLCKHTGVKPHTCGHQGCGKSFCSPFHLSRHELIHSGEKPFPCTVEGCTEAFTTNSNRQRHIDRHHVSRRYVCTYENCGLEFKKNKLLKSHMCEQHSYVPQYHCTFEGCSMRFSDPGKLKRHEKVHKGYPCTEAGCAFTGKTWTDFLAHRREQHRARFSCDECSKTFSNQWNLKQHQRVHSETRLVLRCPREGCERTFTTAFNLQSHVSSFHEEQRPYSCPHPGCGRSFAMKQSLTRHSVIHDPERKKIRESQRKRSLASRLSGFPDPKTSSRPDPLPALSPVINPQPVQPQVQNPSVVLHLHPNSQSHSLDPGLNDVPDQCLGHSHSPNPVQDSVELVSLLKDTSLLCAVNTEALEHLSNALTAPLTV